MLLRTARIFVGMFVLMIPLALAHRVFIARGTYDAPDVKGQRGMVESNGDHPDLYSRGWRVKLTEREIKREEARAREIETKIMLVGELMQ